MQCNAIPKATSNQQAVREREREKWKGKSNVKATPQRCKAKQSTEEEEAGREGGREGDKKVQHASIDMKPLFVFLLLLLQPFIIIIIKHAHANGVDSY